MEGQFFFTTVAGISVSLAGFSALIAGLRDDARVWDPINLWRVKTIIRQALMILFLALLLIPIFYLTGDLRTTVRLGSLGLLLGVGLDAFVNRHPDPTIWNPKMSWTLMMVFSALYAVLYLLNLWWASLGVLQIGYLLELASPAGIFSNFVRELGRSPQPVAEPPVDPGALTS